VVQALKELAAVGLVALAALTMAAQVQVVQVVLVGLHLPLAILLLVCMVEALVAETLDMQTQTNRQPRTGKFLGM